MNNVFGNLDSTVQAELDTYILECNYPKVERIAKRYFRQANLSEPLEHLLLGECDFLSRWINFNLSELDITLIPLLTPSSMEKGLQSILKGIKESSGTEKILLSCVGTKLMVFRGQYKEALDIMLSNVSIEDVTSFFNINSAGVTSASSSILREAVISNTPSKQLPLIPALWSLQCVICWGIALEKEGHVEQAILMYSRVMDFCQNIQATGMEHFARSQSLAPFLAIAMFRYGILCYSLAEEEAAHLIKSSPYKRQQFLTDAAISLRMYLTFIPRNMGGRDSYSLAIETLLKCVDGQFRRCNYKRAFDPEQIYSHSLIRLSNISNLPPLLPPQLQLWADGREEGGLICPVSWAEDELEMILLLASLQPLQPKNKEEAQSGAASPLTKLILSRLALYSSPSNCVLFCESLFARYAADTSTYGRLILAFDASGRHAEAVRAGEIYTKLGGHELSIILIIIKCCLYFPQSCLDLAISLAENATMQLRSDEPSDVELIRSINKKRTLALLQQRNENSHLKAIEILAQLVIEDEFDYEAHLYLAMAYLLNGKPSLAQSSLSTSLSIESDQPFGWIILSLIHCIDAKSHTKGLEIIQDLKENYENYSDYSVIISIVQTAIMGLEGMWESASRIIESLISSLLTPAGPISIPNLSNDPNSTITSLSGLSTTLDPAQFRSRFFTNNTILATESVHSYSSTTAATPIPPAQQCTTLSKIFLYYFAVDGLTIMSYKESFPHSACRVVMRQLRGSASNELLLDESFISSSELLEHATMKALLGPSKHSRNPLLATQLWCWLGEVYLLAGHYNRAELAAHEAFLHNELCARLYSLRGALMEKTSRLETALECYELSLQMQESREARLGCAKCYGKLDKWELASHAITISMAENELDSLVLGMAAETYYNLGEEEKASDLFKKALQSDLHSPPLFTPSFLLSLLNYTV